MAADMSSIDGRPLVASNEPPPGWLFVLSWSLERIGGVNEAVKSLVRCFQDDKTYSPHLLITSERERTPIQTCPVTPLYLDLWPPWDNRHPMRAILSFFYRLPSRSRQLRRIFKRHDVKVINSHFPDLESLTFVLLKKIGQFDGKLILTFHRGDIQGALATKGVERMLWKVLLRGADHLVTVSDGLGRDVLALEPKVAGKLKTIYNGIDSSMFASGNSHKQPTPPGEQIIVAVGAFIPRKGHDVLVRAFSRVVETVAGARLLLIGGSGPEVEPIRELIRSLALSGKVEIHEDVPHQQVSGYLSRASLFALATRGEGHPLAVIEAGACRVPVVCTRATGISELITDHVSGRLVEIDDEIGLAAAMIDMLRHPDKATEMSNNLHEHISNLTWPHAYGQYLELVGATSQGTGVELGMRKAGSG
jgi:glycosyltransferase involved in cell wall biosynthesis